MMKIKIKIQLTDRLVVCLTSAGISALSNLLLHFIMK